MYSDRDVTSRPVIVILGIKFFLSFFLDKVMGSRLYMYIVVHHIVKDVSHSFVCASLGGDQCRPLSTCIEFQRRERQPRPPTALQWGREKAPTLHPTTVHAADPGVSLGIHNKSEPLVDFIV